MRANSQCEERTDEVLSDVGFQFDNISSRVVEALNRVPREKFLPPDLKARAKEDIALPISCDQTISQPQIVALMTEAARLKEGDRVLEVGTGSGYQAAVLAEMGARVFSVERHRALYDEARTRLQKMGYTTIECRQGDGFKGWKEEAPFDAIVVTAAPQSVPPPLVDQLARGGRLIIPVGRPGQQRLERWIRRESKIEKEILLPVRFVPMLSGVPAVE